MVFFLSFFFSLPVRCVVENMNVKTVENAI